MEVKMLTDYLKGLLEGAGVTLRGIDQSYRKHIDVMNDLVKRWDNIPYYAQEEITKEMMK